MSDTPKSLRPDEAKAHGKLCPAVNGAPELGCACRPESTPALPARAWLKPVDVAVPACVPEERRDGALGLAPLVIAYLERRTRCPLVPDPRFYVQVLAHALDQGLASFGSTSKGYYSRAWGESSALVEEGTEDIGLAPGVVWSSSHETLETFLAEQVKTYFAKGKHDP